MFGVGVLLCVFGSSYLMQASAGSSRMNSGSQIGIQLPDDSTSSERSSTGMTSAERHENSLGIGSIAVAKGKMCVHVVVSVLPVHRCIDVQAGT